MYSGLYGRICRPTVASMEGYGYLYSVHYGRVTGYVDLQWTLWKCLEAYYGICGRVWKRLYTLLG